ncbi:hypothetical protein JYT78_00740 [bacterium AH-315-I20]|nr:hypothetical protein [bacterium AH-315-I20]
MNIFWKYLLSLCVVLLLISCSDSGEDTNNNNNSGISVDKAYFVDSGVAGLSYNSPSYRGVTDNIGGFQFKAGEITTFSYGGLDFGSIATPNGSSVFTPLDLFNTTDVNHQSVKNMLVLLQTLDSDQNPTNGISLNPASNLSNPVFLNTLDVTSPAFQSQLAPAFVAGGLGTITVVLEVDALAHFNDTLLKINATPNIVGRWLDRDSLFGDAQAIFDFSADQTMTTKEFDVCNNVALVNENVGTNQCSIIARSGSWTLNGKSLTMTGNGITDRCTIISSSAYLIDAVCTFQGGGLGAAFRRFERDTPQLSNALLNNTYREVLIGGDTSYTQQTFNSDLSGSYVFHNTLGAAQSGPQDLGTYTWMTTATQLSYNGTDNTLAAFALTYDIGVQIGGALAASTTGVNGNLDAVLIPNFRNRVSSNGISGIYQVYDGITGVYKKDYSFNQNQLTESNVNYPYIVRNGAIAIDRGLQQETCWPMTSYNTTESGVTYVVACETNASIAFKIEYWRGT